MKNLKLLLITIFILVATMMLTSEIYATEVYNLKIEKDGNISYIMNKENQTTEIGMFQIKDNTDTTPNSVSPFYCVKANIEFTVPTVGYREYGVKYNFKENANDVINYYRQTINYNITDEQYNAVLWIADNMYIPEHTDSAYMRERLLEKILKWDAGNNITEEQLKTVTDLDIKIAQQSAIWFFTDADTLYGTKWQDRITGLSEDRLRQTEVIYNYFVVNAILNAEKYGTENVRELALTKTEINVDTTSKQVTGDNNFAVVGPFSITKIEGDLGYTQEIVVKDKLGNAIPTDVIYVVKDTANMVADFDTVEDAINQGNFYLKIPKVMATNYDLTDVNIEATVENDKEYKTTITLLTEENNESQPVIQIERKEIGEFNIVLNKVNEDGELLAGANFRIFKILNGQENEPVAITSTGNGIFNLPTTKIAEAGQEFIYLIEEYTAPEGYIALNDAFRVKITTGLNDSKTAFIVKTINFIDEQGQPVNVEGVTFEYANNTMKFTIANEKMKEFDLSLRKYITKVNGVEVETRVPQVDTSKLNTIDSETGKRILTATYAHSKEPIIVKKGDIVTFKIRVYNEGDIDGAVKEIADYIPEGLGYLLNYKSNTDNGWHAINDDTTKTLKLVGTEGLYETEDLIKNIKPEDFYTLKSLKDVQILAGNAKLYSDNLEDEIIKAYNPELTVEDIENGEKWQQSVNGKDGLYYEEVEVTCIVLAENTFKGTLRNIAEIQEDEAIDENGEAIDVADRDSTVNNVKTAEYNPPADNSTYQEDDDDYELLELKYFDLALRKFITAVNSEEVTTRIPTPTIDNDGKLKYEHDKTPVYVANSDLVTYTIRVYNEGTVAGYAIEVSDDIPDGLVFLPEHKTNKQHNWKMYDSEGKETTDYTKAVEIRTEYLKDSLLNPYDATQKISATEPLNPDYADVKVVFQIIEENITGEDRIIINKAQITDDMAVDEENKELDLEDEDSIPDKWNEGEDDQDIEKVYVKKFDLALLKWVTQTAVTVDGKTTTTDTGFTPYDDPEPIAKVVIDKKKVNETVVKFVYNIIIMNQGEIAGYATEITDYIPEGLEFVAEDNPLWTKEGDNKITTRALEEKLLQPGESATVKVVFTWKNGEDNFGLKTNIAEISEDYNDKGSKDIDSEPDNVEIKDYEEQQEDDDDKALVILETKTGGATSYIWLGLIVLLIIAGGITLIQKYVM